MGLSAYARSVLQAGPVGYWPLGEVGYARQVMAETPLGYWRLGEQGYNRQVLAETPSAYWVMNEASGNLTDSSGNAVTATANGSPSYTQPGPTSDAQPGILFHAATSDYFDAGTGFNFNGTTAFTVSFWIKITAAPGIGIFQRVLSRLFTDGGGLEGWDIRVIGAGDSPQPLGGLFLNRRVSGVAVTVTIPSLPLNVWNHVVWTYNGALQTCYLNGVIGPAGTSADAASIPVGAANVNLGRRNDNAGNYFDGYLSKVALVTGRAISAAEVAALYAARTSSDATISANAVDSSGNGNTATYGSGAILGQPGVLADGTPAAAFSYDVAKVTLPILAQPTGAMSVMGWITVNPIPAPASAQFDRLIARSWATVAKNGWIIFVQYNTDGTKRIVGGLSEGTTQRVVSTLTTPGTYFVVITYDGATTVTMYINGVATGTATPSGALTLTVTDAPVIGLSNGNVAHSNYTVDEVAIVNRAISAAEVAALYAARTQTDPTVSAAAADLSTGAHTGTYSVGPLLGQTAPAGTGYPSAGFETTRANVMTTPLTEADIPNTAWTIAGWFKTSVLATLQTIVSRVNTRPQLLVGSDNALQLDVFDGSVHVILGAGGASVVDGAFHYAVGTYDGTNLRLYRDGVLIAGPTASNGYQASAGAWLVGCRNDLNSPFGGSLGSVALYNKALSLAQIQAQFAAGRFGYTGSRYRLGSRANWCY